MHDGKDLEGLRPFTPDRRDYDDWAYNDEFCHGLLLHKQAEAETVKNGTPANVVLKHWHTAIEFYWRDRKSRRELANELGLSIDAIKSLLATIRKAAHAYKQSGQQFENETPGKSFNGRCHTSITANEVLELADGNAEITAYVEEFRRLTVISQLRMFDGQIAGRLTEILQRSYLVGKNIAARLIAHADKLKASVAKQDAFEGRPVIQTLASREPNYHCDRRGRPRKKATVISYASNGSGYFFGANGLNDTLVDGKKSNTGIKMHKQAAEIIKQYEIPRSTIAKLANMHLPDLSGYLNGRLDVSDDKMERVSQVVQDVVLVIEAMGSLGVKIDLTDIENVKSLIRRVNDAAMQMKLFEEAQEQEQELLTDFRIRPIDGAADAVGAN